MSATGAVPIAIIDDDESLCRALGRWVRLAGFRPVTFHSAEEFLESRERQGLRCLLLDIQLGGMSGLALHRRLVAEGDTTPVIYMTARDEPSVRVEALNMGCAAFFLKPGAGTSIIEALRRVTAPT